MIVKNAAQICRFGDRMKKPRDDQVVQTDHPK